MGLTYDQDITQQYMDCHFRDLQKDKEVFINDIEFFSDDWGTYVILLDSVRFKSYKKTDSQLISSNVNGNLRVMLT